MVRVFKNPSLQAEEMIQELTNKYEAGKYRQDGQIDESLSKMFDSEDEAIDFANANGYDYVTGYTYKPGKEEPHSSFGVWDKIKGYLEY